MTSKKTNVFLENSCCRSGKINSEINFLIFQTPFMMTNSTFPNLLSSVKKPMNRRHNRNFKALIEKADQEKKLELLVQWTLSEFDLFYTRFNEITESAKTAFEKKDYNPMVVFSESWRGLCRQDS